MATEEARGVAAGEQGGLPGATLGHALDPEQRIDGRAGCPPSPLLALAPFVTQGGRLAAEKPGQRGQSSLQERIPARIGRADTHTVQKEEEDPLV
jgi:hypothetical protein